MWIEPPSPRALVALILSPIVLYLLLRWFEYHQVYHPYTSFWAEGGALGRKWEDVYFKTTDGVRLNGWFFPALEASRRKRLAVLICHGNGGNISHRLETYNALLRAGASVFAFDYRGYGRSDGKADEPGTYLDAQAALAWLRDRGFQASNIVGYGESLGGAVVTELALREALGGLVLQSTFTSVPDIGAEIFPWLPVRLISTIKYDTLSKIPRLQLPLMVMHSREDSIVPYHHGRKLFDAAHEPKLFWELTGDHNDLPASCLAQFEAGLNKLLDMVAEHNAAGDCSTRGSPEP